MAAPEQPTLTQALAAITAGACSARDVLEACLTRIAEREPTLGAWAYLQEPAALLESYDRRRAVLERTPLRGLPLGIKDIIDTADMPTELGSPIHAGRRPADDAACVALLRAAGALLPGKTVTTEFAYFKPGKTVNPHDPTRTPGGSSSGSAAAVAAGMVPAALGSQTAASVIRPAAFCGVVGYVASRGELTLRGVQPLAQSLDALGLLARSVGDVALLRGLLLHGRPGSLGAPEAAPTLLLCRGEAVGPVEPAMLEVCEAAAVRLARAGARIVEVDFGLRLKQLVESHHLVLAFEAARNLAAEAAQPERLSAPLAALLAEGRELPYERYRRALDYTAQAAAWLEAAAPEAEAILAPAAPGVAPEGLEKTGAPHMSRPWQALGRPTVALPGFCDPAGLPLGLQLVGRPRCDDRLLALAGWVETVFAGADGG